MIYMTAVDTGWINDEKPAEAAAADARVHNFQAHDLSRDRRMDCGT